MKGSFIICAAITKKYTKVNRWLAICSKRCTCTHFSTFLKIIMNKKEHTRIRLVNNISFLIAILVQYFFIHVSFNIFFVHFYTNFKNEQWSFQLVWLHDYLKGVRIKSLQTVKRPSKINGRSKEIIDPTFIFKPTQHNQCLTWNHRIWSCVDYLSELTSSRVVTKFEYFFLSAKRPTSKNNYQPWRTMYISYS